MLRIEMLRIRVLLGEKAGQPSLNPANRLRKVPFVGIYLPLVETRVVGL